MKHLSLFEDFKDTPSAQITNLLKDIDKAYRYNLKFGSLAENNYTFQHSEIVNNGGLEHYLKIEICSDDVDEYLWHLIFLIKEEDALNDKIENIFFEIQIYKLPQYKKISTLSKNVKVSEVLKDDFITKNIKEAKEKILKNPKDKEDYKNNLKKI